MLVTVRNFFGGIVIITGGVLFYLEDYIESPKLISVRKAYVFLVK